MLQILVPILVAALGYAALVLSAKWDPNERDRGGMK
jgi:hypothetical protein